MKRRKERKSEGTQQEIAPLTHPRSAREVYTFCAKNAREREAERGVSWRAAAVTPELSFRVSLVSFLQDFVFFLIISVVFAEDGIVGFGLAQSGVKVEIVMRHVDCRAGDVRAVARRAREVV